MLWSPVETLLQCTDLASCVRLLKPEHVNTGLELIRRIRERLLAILQHSTQVTTVFSCYQLLLGMYIFKILVGTLIPTQFRTGTKEHRFSVCIPSCYTPM